VLFKTDVLVIGGGIAGAVAALRLAEEASRHVTVITRERDAAESSTFYAQGGIVSRGVDDSPEQLVEDILAAGAGMASPDAATAAARKGPSLVDALLIDRYSIPFDRNEDGTLSLAREGGHTAARILHVQDATGRAIEETLIEVLRNVPNVDLRTGWTAVDLITSPHHNTDPLSVYRRPRCHGCYVLDRETGEVHRIVAPATILATGGLGQIFRHTSNPPGARGDGLAMAYRAGARIVNAEYVQFHPTTLAVDGARNFLVSEAVRGAGAHLLTPSGDRFMERYAPDWKELAPRDVVARAMHQEMVEGSFPHILLDIASVLDASAIEREFPTIVAACREAGIDATTEPIPVVPAAHYACGGVLSDLRARTTLAGLYAVGEVSCTGLHGANRLASMSLLEGLVWGTAAAEDIAARNDLTDPPIAELRPWTPATHGEVDPVLILRDMETARNIMWHYVGLARSTSRLRRAVEDLDHLWHGIDDFYRRTELSDSLVGLRNMVQCAWIIARAAQRNPESRGTHWRADKTTA